MNIENKVKDVITAKLEEGIIEKLVAENLEKGINKSLENLLGSYGDITKVIEKNIKEVMIDQISKYDFSQHIVKLDYVLTEILKNTVLDNKKILNNFKAFMTDIEIPRNLKISDVFNEYCKFVEKNVDTSNLEVCTDDSPSYEMVEVSFEVEEQEKRSWSNISEANIFFECEKDENLNFEVKLTKWKNENWKLDLKRECDISSLRHIDEFMVYLIKVSQNYTNIEIDTWRDATEVQPEAEPEANWS